MSAPPADMLRIAVEGCGHGTLDAIYDAVARSCQEKDWDGVDALIIGGDFQATRNKRDLNVTAMPPKYREMADFHQYYSGAKMAPCLTIFVGGNHEASNHLHELYYGGWVAPNIYFLGAANIIRLGNIRIAGLSGIWKGYDYRKPHFERLPYNQEDISSIYHVRELDVRKLLAVRSQVDIGISHDWPQSVEWSGDWEWLFRRKDGFQRDAEDKSLGNEAAKYVLDRLRPPHWFSAHLHIRYTATYDHVNPKGIQTKSRSSYTRPADHQQLSAWQEFGVQAQKDEAIENQQLRAAHDARKEEEARTGVSSKPVYKFDETFKKVVPGQTDLSRKIESVSKSETDTSSYNAPPQLDGCSASRPLKRSRVSDSPQGDGRVQTRSPRFSALDAPTPRDVALGKTTKPFSPPKSAGRPGPGANPDELDLGSDEEVVVGTLPVLGRPRNSDQLDLGSDEDDTVMAPRRASSPFPNLNAAVTERKSEQSEDGGAPLNPIAADFTPVKQGGVVMARQTSGSSRSSLDPAAKPFKPEDKGPDSPMSTSSPINPEAAVFVPRTNDVDHKKPEEAVEAKEEISAEVRSQLGGMSKTFTAPVRVEKSADLPFPEEITNKTTKFLALDKCLPNRNFLELIEVESISAPDDLIVRPLKLHYDPEFLAIQRVFADELTLGGKPSDPGPPHRGDTYYQDRILEERKWVFQNIVLNDQLQVPDNFEITAPVYDPDEQVDMRDLPREVTNPQTSAFCQLIGIDNKFDVPQAERDAREAAGPRPESERFRSRRGASRGGRGGNQRGGGGRGGRGGGGRGGGRGGGYGGGRGRGGQRGRGY